MTVISVFSSFSSGPDTDLSHKLNSNFNTFMEETTDIAEMLGKIVVIRNEDNNLNPEASDIEFFDGTKNVNVTTRVQREFPQTNLIKVLCPSDQTGPVFEAYVFSETSNDSLVVTKIEMNVDSGSIEDINTLFVAPNAERPQLVTDDGLPSSFIRERGREYTVMSDGTVVECLVNEITQNDGGQGRAWASLTAWNSEGTKIDSEEYQLQNINIFNDYYYIFRQAREEGRRVSSSGFDYGCFWYSWIHESDTTSHSEGLGGFAFKYENGEFVFENQEQVYNIGGTLGFISFPDAIDFALEDECLLHILSRNQNGGDNEMEYIHAVFDKNSFSFSSSVEWSDFSNDLTLSADRYGTHVRVSFLDLDADSSDRRRRIRWYYKHTMLFEEGGFQGSGTTTNFVDVQHTPDGVEIYDVYKRDNSSPAYDVKRRLTRDTFEDIDIFSYPSLVNPTHFVEYGGETKGLTVTVDLFRLDFACTSSFTVTPPAAKEANFYYTTNISEVAYTPRITDEVVDVTYEYEGGVLDGSVPPSAVIPIDLPRAVQ